VRVHNEVWHKPTLAEWHVRLQSPVTHIKDIPQHAIALQKHKVREFSQVNLPGAHLNSLHPPGSRWTPPHPSAHACC
jgi:hypothetical protein